MTRAFRRSFAVPSAALVGALLAVAASGLPASAQPKPPRTDFSGLPEKIPGEEIKANWFDGRPIVAAGPDGSRYTMVFTPDGKAARTPIGPKKPRTVTGFWRVIAEGYCSRWTGNSREKCFNVRKSPDGNEIVVRFGLQVVATWQRP